MLTINRRASSIRELTLLRNVVAVDTGGTFIATWSNIYGSEMTKQEWVKHVSGLLETKTPYSFFILDSGTKYEGEFTVFWVKFVLID